MHSARIYRLSQHLYQAGSWNHLPDESLTKISMLIRGLPRSGDFSGLISYWYEADFFGGFVPPYLLPACNECLIALGRPCIETLVDTCFEA